MDRASKSTRQSATTEKSPEGSTSEPLLFNERTLAGHEAGLRAGMERLHAAIRGAEQPFSGIQPEALAERFAEIDLNRPCGELQAALDEIEALYLQHTVYYHHPQYLAHLNCPVALPAIVGELIQSSINTAVETWDQSGGGTLVEQKLIDWTATRIGYGAGADGVFTSGGTQSNLMALLLARDAYCRDHLGIPDVQHQGITSCASRLRILASSEAHFSVQKAAGVLGLGREAVIPVACDGQFRMDPAALEGEVEAALARGEVPMSVVATVGTTDFGSIDPLERIADLCGHYGLWMHADAAYGCGLLVSREHTDLTTGLARADSVTIDYHKSFFQPVSCSGLLVRDHRNLHAVTWHADYLNPGEDAAEGTPNLVDKSLQTTRRFDALKLWLTLRAAGADAIGRSFDRGIALAGQTYWLLGADPEFETVHRPTLSTIVFRYRPAGLNSNAQLDEVNRHIKQALLESGRAVVAGTTVCGAQYLKFTLLDPETTVADIRGVIEEIRCCGEGCLAAGIVGASAQACADQGAS